MKKKIIYFFIGIILFIAIWSFISLKINSEIIFPSINKIFLDLINIISQKDFYSNLLYTFIRVIVTFVLSFFKSTEYLYEVGYRNSSQHRAQENQAGG